MEKTHPSETTFSPAAMVQRLGPGAMLESASSAKRKLKIDSMLRNEVYTYSIYIWYIYIYVSWVPPKHCFTVDHDPPSFHANNASQQKSLPNHHTIITSIITQLCHVQQTTNITSIITIISRENLEISQSPTRNFPLKKNLPARRLRCFL